MTIRKRNSGIPQMRTSDPVVPHSKMQFNREKELPRFCTYRGCGKKLSIYNSTSRCSACDDARFKEEIYRRGDE